MTPIRLRHKGSFGVVAGEYKRSSWMDCGLDIYLKCCLAIIAFGSCGISESVVARDGEETYRRPRVGCEKVCDVAGRISVVGTLM